MLTDVLEELKQALTLRSPTGEHNADFGFDGGALNPASAEDLEQARQFGLPEILISLYKEHAPVSSVQLHSNRIWSVQKAIEENRDYVPGADLFPLGYVVFASTMSGDAYCIDTIHVGQSGDSPVMLFPHDVIEDGTSLEDVEPYRLPVAADLEDFLRQFTSGTLIDKPKYI